MTFEIEISKVPLICVVIYVYMTFEIRDFKGPFDSGEIWRNLHFGGKIKGGGPLKSRIIAIFQIRKSLENPEISEIAISLEF